MLVSPEFVTRRQESLNLLVMWTSVVSVTHNDMTQLYDFTSASVNPYPANVDSMASSYQC
jgi:hypothetical protein